ncbi:MAG: thioredoxin family protein [Bacteroidia bacterium]|nr:thioredoxin family protein [Bacteroidia bacterium]MCX7764831.1 thioredoxin family protein [Bacteroidia bacterium]MDW8057528.1 thioredoxin family protein [Bacteroidia bacterium]
MPTYAETIPLGTALPSFSLLSVCGEHIDSEMLRQKPLVVVFTCGHCPYVQAVEGRMLQLAAEFIPRGVQWIGIASNDPTLYPEDSPEALCRRTREKNYPFPILYDETQAVAKAFGALCTPEFFVYDANHRLYYHGRLDDNWKDPAAVTKQELREALELLLAGMPAPQPQYPAMGCSIKWRQP